MYRVRMLQKRCACCKARASLSLISLYLSPPLGLIDRVIPDISRSPTHPLLSSSSSFSPHPPPLPPPPPPPPLLLRLALSMPPLLRSALFPPLCSLSLSICSLFSSICSLSSSLLSFLLYLLSFLLSALFPPLSALVPPPCSLSSSLPSFLLALLASPSSPPSSSHIVQPAGGEQGVQLADGAERRLRLREERREERGERREEEDVRGRCACRRLF
jgi:hypothetical protein